MKNYIRVCLSLDKETIDLLEKLKKWTGQSKSEIMKRCVKRYCSMYMPAELTIDIKK